MLSRLWRIVARERLQVKQSTPDWFFDRKQSVCFLSFSVLYVNERQTHLVEVAAMPDSDVHGYKYIV